MELTFSAVDNFDIPMLIRALRIPGHMLKLVEDLKSRRRLVRSEGRRGGGSSWFPDEHSLPLLVDRS